MPEPDPADSRGLGVTAGPPTQAPVVRVVEVLISTTARVHEASDEDWDLHPPVTDGGVFDLGHGVRLERLDEEDAELIMDACEPRGHFFHPKRQYTQRYAYIYEPSEEQWHENRLDWDPDQRVNAAMHLSRLVKDNTDSMEYAARVFIHEDGQRQVVPCQDFELGRAYSLRTGRDWLDAGEAAQLRALLDAYWAAAGDLASAGSTTD